MLRRRVAFLVVAICLLAAAGKQASPKPPSKSDTAKPPSKSDTAKQIRFGSEMAKQGNWREAIFRWQRALASDPANPRLHNNLAVAYESIAEYGKAEAEYKAALASADAPGEVRENYEMFLKFYGRYKEAAAGPAQAGPSVPGGADEKAP